MDILQLYYTSAKKGLGNGPGFQTYSMSNGISETEREEIQRLIGYVPPSNLPPQPTEEEIDNLFPQSFSFFRLGSGRYGVFQSTYVGKDYSNRYGNYFSHVLLFDGEQLPFYPMGLYGSPIFRTKLTLEEETNMELPAPLPVLQDILENPLLSLENIAAFLQKEERLDQLKAILNTIVFKDQTGKRFMILDEKERLPYWFAAIQMSFPLQLAQQITFTTYSHNPDRNAAVLCSTWTSGTRFSYSNTNSYYLFDFLKNNLRPAQQQSDYVDFMIESWRQSPEKICRFFELTQKFTLNKIDIELDQLLSINKIINSGLQHISQQELLSALDFVNQYGKTEMFAMTIDHLYTHWWQDRKWESDLLNLTMDAAESIALFLFYAVKQTEQKNHRKVAYKFFFDSIDQFMINSHSEEEIQQVIRYYEKVQQLMSDSYEFNEQAVQHERLAKLDYLKTKPNYSKIHFYLMKTVDHFLSLNLDWSLLDKGQQAFFFTCLGLLPKQQSNMVEIMGVIGKKTDYFINIFLGYYQSLANSQNAGRKEEFEQTFSIVINKSDERWQNIVINSFIEDPQGRLLIINSFCRQLKASSQPVALFEDYYNKVFQKIPSIEEYLPEVLGKVIKSIRSDVNGQIEILLQRFAPFMNIEQVTYLLEKYEKSLDLYSPLESKKELFRQMESLIVERNLNVTDFIFPLLRITMEIQDGTKKPLELKSEIYPYLEKLSDEKYEKYVEWSLPKLLSIFTKRKSYAISILYIPGKELAFWKSLLSYTETLKKGKYEPTIYFFSYCLGQKVIEEKFISYLIKYFQQNKTEFKKINELVAKHALYEKNKQFRENWQSIQMNVLKKKSDLNSKDSFLQKFKSFFEK